MANNLISMAGWYFLPNLVTGYIQTALYTLLIRAGEPKPQPGAPRFIQDRKRIFTAVILLYLLYTVYEADWQLRLSGDFYQALGVSHSATERDVQSRFRRLTVQFHPDKVPPGADKAAVEAIYVQLTVARDTLIHPAKRSAYDRLGSDILQWRHCKTLRDFIVTGVQRTALYYAGSGSVLVLLGVLGYLQQGKFWRYLVMAALLVIEVQTVMRPDFPRVLSTVVNPFLVATKLRSPYLPFQMLTLLRKLTITFFIALSQLGPVLQGPNVLSEDDAVPPQQLDRVDALTVAADQEVSRLLGLELAPFAGGEAAMRDLRTSLKEWLVQNTIRNDPDVRAAITRTLDRRRGQATADVNGQ
ncbi:hypothetical protein BAUCODRAFT_381853 [Baudoinia panamericana UAMH 10762]|uniref:J domain-containing protein n=1 Tax=Baudoinia panamericana (strain UAMH 10762) TaxID=717646 RepID=M2MPY8_BAUPA|nr:uncharacterized protein BAUCODRAFT_381853 [Baudoinia panamericana UAMH 10762]EMC98836.1 hypothetical protein BAUCODRAFT_381853 [Baudoinia panamericana UAMH 10762]